MFGVEISLLLAGVAIIALGISSVLGLLRIRRLEKKLKDHCRRGHHSHGIRE